MKDIILFDFDGTLFETGPSIVHAICRTLSQFEITIKDPSYLYKHIGPTIRETFSSVFNLQGEDLDKAVGIYRTISEKEGYDRILPYPGIREMLSGLNAAGKILAIATSKPTPHAVALSKRFGLFDYFSCISGSSMDGRRSSKSLMIQTALNTLGLEHSEYNRCVMVGDRKYDVVGAKEIGIPCIGVTYGYGTREELRSAGAIATVDSVPDLCNLLLMETEVRDEQ